MTSEQQDVRARLRVAIARTLDAADVRLWGSALDDLLNNLAALLAPAPGVPEGWRLVPVEPTEAMVEAAIAETKAGRSPRNVLHAGIAAAPTPAPIPAAADTAVMVERPSDGDLDDFLPESLRSEKRCGIRRSEWLGGWFVPWSPRNDNQNAEGPWSHWVALAHEIIRTDVAALAQHRAQPVAEALTDSGAPGVDRGEG